MNEDALAVVVYVGMSLFFVFAFWVIAMVMK